MNDVVKVHEVVLVSSLECIQEGVQSIPGEDLTPMADSPGRNNDPEYHPSPQHHLWPGPACTAPEPPYYQCCQ